MSLPFCHNSNHIFVIRHYFKHLSIRQNLYFVFFDAVFSCFSINLEITDSTNKKRNAQKIRTQKSYICALAFCARIFLKVLKILASCGILYMYIYALTLWLCLWFVTKYRFRSAGKFRHIFYEEQNTDFVLTNQTQFFKLSFMLCRCCHQIDASCVNAAVSQHISQSYNILTSLIEYRCK